MEQQQELELSQQCADWKRLQRGWCCGPKGFREQMPELVGTQQGRQHYGKELREAEEQKAERLVAQMMRQVGWGETELKRRAKGDVRKARTAARLRAQTTMCRAWIAARLEMGHWRTAVNATRGAAIRNLNAR